MRRQKRAADAARVPPLSDSLSLNFLAELWIIFLFLCAPRVSAHLCQRSDPRPNARVVKARFGCVVFGVRAAFWRAWFSRVGVSVAFVVCSLLLAAARSCSFVIAPVFVVLLPPFSVFSV